MRWGKFILFFQAVVTLVIGIVFLMQVFNIQYNYEEEIKNDFTEKNIGSVVIYDELVKYHEFKKRFFNASYILVLISLIEIVIIWRLLDRSDVSTL